MKNKISYMAFMFLMAFLSSSCAQKSIGKGSDGLKISKATAVKSVPSSNYKVSAGDLLDIKFFHHQEYNETVRIRPDGKITIPLVHDFICAGKTPGEIENGLKQAYRQELKDPDIAIILREFAGYKVYICGEVKNSMVVQLVTPTTLFQAVIMAGDTLPSAREKNVLIIRNQSDGSPETILADLKQIKKGKMQDVPLKPYDIVYVPKTAIASADEFVEQYINSIVPRNLTFPFTYEIHRDD